MGNNNKYFYISGFISVSLFSFFALLITFTLFSKKNINAFALKKDNYISISLDTPKVNKSSKKTIAIKAQEQSVVEQKDVNIDDLFSDVWTKNLNTKKKKEEKVDNKRVVDIGKKFKKIDKKSAEKVMEESTDSEIQNRNNDSQKTSTANVVNEYLAKIQALVYENFVPPQNSQGYTVKAVIELSAIGKVMDFRILTYSDNTSLNEECDKIKNRLIGVLFPINPQNKTGSYIVLLTSKE